MYSIDKQQDWVRFSRRLEREIRVLIIEVNPQLRKELEDLLYRCRLSARAVPSEEQARKLITSGHYSLVVVPEVMPGKNGTALIHQLQAEFPELDFILTTKSPSLELVSWAFDLNVRDIVRRPVQDSEDVADQFRQAARRNAERRIREYLLAELRELYEKEVATINPKISGMLESRLNAFKDLMGAGRRILVVEPEHDVRPLSESLFMAGFEVETVLELDNALLRLHRGDINLMLLKTAQEPGEVAGLMESILDTDPTLDTVLISPTPDIANALLALRLGAALHLPLLPDTHELLVDRIGDILHRGRRKRLLDNLLVELYMTLMHVAVGTVKDQDLELLHGLCGLSPNIPLNFRPVSKGIIRRDTLDESTSYLDNVLDEIMPAGGAGGPVVEYRRITGKDLKDEDRRIHMRLVEDHFIRVRQATSPSGVMAQMGNLSEGGLFVRTQQLLQPGTEVDLDFNLELDGAGYQVCCEAAVAWSTKSSDDFYLGPGFGVKFIRAPKDVLELVKSVILARGAADEQPPP